MGKNDCCGRHFHSSVEVVCVKSGELKADLNGTVYEVCKGQILIVPSYTVPHYVTECTSLIDVCVIPLEHVSSFKPLLAHKTFASVILMESLEYKEIYHCLEGMRLVVWRILRPILATAFLIFAVSDTWIGFEFLT